MDSPAALAVALASVVAVLYLAAIAYAIVQIARTRDLSEVEKALWMTAVVFAPLLGALVWYVARPHTFGLVLTDKLR
ncbi:MAG: PLDc N-terminal domain-containing protein [Kineosporiaceae bacterium]|nr:PLDc N-terminal domain-containing protein [Aeromicrobium sp.]